MSEGRILSRPLGVEWCGWRSDTLRLQQCRWQIAVNYEPMRNQYQLLMKNESLRLCAVTEIYEIERTIADQSFDMSRVPVFRVVQVAPQIQVYRASCEMLPVSNFEEIDATPQFVTSKIESLYDLNIFATKRAEQVLIDKADLTVVEHLEAIKRLQSPKQQEIRQRLMRDEGKQQAPRLHLVANLVHYAEAA